MLWAILSVLSGLGDAIGFAFMKKLKGTGNSVVVWVQYAFALPFLLALLYFSYPEKIIADVYWVALVNSILLIIPAYLLVKATQISDLSVSMPMLSLTPLFLIITSYLMRGELPTFYGVIGIFLIAAGAYTVNINHSSDGFLEPFKRLIKDKGPFYAIIVAFIWSITSNLFKTGILYSGPVFYNAVVYLFSSMIMLPLVFIKFKDKVRDIKTNFNSLILLGCLSAFMTVLAAYAMLSSIVPYVIALKRSSVIFSVLIGFIFFKEKNFKHAIIGSGIMFIGAVLIMVA
jgi:drug/metabolite transporter (DMT)-like permease